MKHKILVNPVVQEVIREQDPLKQGLKLAAVIAEPAELIIREQDPLKQGLKLFLILFLFRNCLIREQDPLKQGLKHELRETFSRDFFNS